MLFETAFARLPRVNSQDIMAAWRPGYGEWLGAHVAEGFDHTTTARYLEEKDIALEEMKAGDRDPAYALRQDAEALSPGALRQAFALKGWTKPAPDHAHAMTEADWKASPWYRKEIPFRQDMTATRARIMAENFDRRRYREQILARGGEVYGGAGNVALGFGATLLGALPDPINLLPFGGGMAAASRAKTLGSALWTGARYGAVEGAAATALADGIVLPDLASRGEDRDFTDLALDTFAGGVLGGVLGAAGGALARRMAGRHVTGPVARDHAGTVPATASTPSPAPFDASPDGSLLARAGEGPAAQPGEVIYLGDPLPAQTAPVPLRDFDASPDGGFLERAGQGPFTHADEIIYLGDPLPEPPGPAPLPEGMRWRQHMTELSFQPETRSRGDQMREDFARRLHGDAAQAAREARIAAARERARQAMTTGDRRTVAEAAALSMEDTADARPVDVSAVLEESGALERAYDSVVRDPLDGRPDDVLATLQPEEIERVLVHRGPAVMRDGQIVVQGRELQRETGSRSGYGMVKIIFGHGEKGNKRPDMPPVTREDVVALPRLFREFENFIEGDHRVWRIPREDGNALHIVTRHGEGGPGERLVSMYVGPLQPKQTFSAKKPPVASSALVSGRSRDTGLGNMVSRPAGKQGASHMTDSSLPDAAAPVNRPAPDFSTAAESPAPARLTPDEARRTETEALHRQDEALRQGMNDLEAQGRADTGELTTARTDAESSEAFGRETLGCAWTVEE